MKTERKLKSIKLGIDLFMGLKDIQTELIKENDYSHISMENVVLHLLLENDKLKEELNKK